ncbi:MAG: hypothetical protein PHS92_00535 [Candidatus Gracilibacteria bacterium]|nr:hypothetical protein [Candidatus Gracilibacteria bacterium]
MDFFLSSSVVKYEIIFLLLNLAYIVLHLLYDMSFFLNRVIKIIKPKKYNIEEIESKLNEVNISETNNTTQDEISSDVETSVTNKEETKKKEGEALTSEQKDTIGEFIKIAKTKLARGEYIDAKAKIIEGLSIDKFNKELNILLASMYEKDKDYKKAELIYKDLIVLNDLDIEIYLKLGFVLSVQAKYEIAYEIYKKLHSIDETNIEAIEMLANLSHHLSYFDDSKAHAKKFLKNNPRSIDIIYLQALNHINLSERQEALEMLNKVKQLEPYNSKVLDLIEKLKLELELEKNFKG